MMCGEAGIQDHRLPELQEFQLVQCRRNEGPLEDAIVHRVHPEDDTVTLQFPSDQQQIRVHREECIVEAFQPIEFPTVRLAPGEQMPTSAEAYENWKMKQMQPSPNSPAPSPVSEMASKSETEAMLSGSYVNGTMIFGETTPADPALQVNGAIQPPPPGCDEACRTQFFGAPLSPPSLQGGGTQFFGDEANVAFQASTIFDNEAPATPAMNQPVPAHIIAELLKHQKACGVKTVLDKNWGMPAPTQYALYKRGLPEEKLSTEYGEHIYSGLYRHQYGEREKEPVSYVPGTMDEDGKLIMQHTYIPLSGPMYTQTVTGHWFPEAHHEPSDFGYAEGQSDFGYLDGGFAKQDNRLVGYLDDWFDGLFA